MGAHDCDSQIETAILNDKLLRGREQFSRSEVSELEFARAMDARYRAMLEGGETAHDLVDEG